MTHEKFEGERVLMRIHVGESDKWHGKSLHDAIVEMLRKEGFSGATVEGGLITLEKVHVILYRAAKR
jgi:PII-like signaling protein